jgi:hypothetical protein
MQAFLYVDRQFKDVMRRTKDRPNAMLVSSGVHPGITLDVGCQSSEVWQSACGGVLVACACATMLHLQSQIATTPGLLEIFQKCNETLEQVQKNLEVGVLRAGIHGDMADCVYARCRPCLQYNCNRHLSTCITTPSSQLQDYLETKRVSFPRWVLLPKTQCSSHITQEAASTAES